MNIRRTAVLLALFTLAFADAASAQRRRSVHSTEPVFNPLYSEGGYTSSPSVMQGSSIGLHIATSVRSPELTIINLADPNRFLVTRTFTSEARNCSGRTASGCGWPRTLTIDIPYSWPSGYYAASFPTAFGVRYATFVVRPAFPTSRSQMVVIAPTHTYQAYNDFGGRSAHPTDDPARATHLSYDRPYAMEKGLGRYPLWEKNFVDWMTQTNRLFEVITDADLEQPNILQPYRVVVLVGHSEYWTASARAQLEQFSQRGGHIAVLGGNSMWWQVRLEDNNRTVVAFKGAEYDPALGQNDSLVTTNWYASPVNNPENRVLGASFRNGGFTNRVADTTKYDMVPIAERVPFTVTDASHWVFEGTGFRNGDTFGREITGLEVDGVVFNCDPSGRIIGPEGSDEAPRNYHILATVPASTGWGTMGLFVNQSGGAVFNGATQGWAGGLFDDRIGRITANVLDRFMRGPLPYDPVNSSIYTQDLFNCQHPTFSGVGWRRKEPGPAVTAACAYEGPGGLELSGTTVLGQARSLAPMGQTRDRVELRFYVKADEFVGRGPVPAPIVSLRNRDGETTQIMAYVELDNNAGIKRVRLAVRRPEFRVSDWINLDNGWHLIEASWRSPGTLTLSVDGNRTASFQNPVSGQTVNELVVEFPATTNTQTGRVCIDAIAAGSQKLGAIGAASYLEW
ncbi:MAG TPA: N,N-dimethylformamidase beta subunit family domain-containing protein [Thermoanaerobaculia bacterium]|jgi:hypothetical protein|nr:N,N-dimethylformamidase beta subunit family domain-containing protein [Thermoanaerobaculia bacterium]